MSSLAATSPFCPQLTVASALEIALNELSRRALSAQYYVSRLYAGADRQTEGAAFAAIMSPLRRAMKPASKAKPSPRLKLLIYDNGQTALNPIVRNRG